MGFQRINSSTRVLTKFEGADIVIPKFKCKKCDLPIDRSFTRTTEKCGYCHDGFNDIGKNIDRIYSISFYVPKESRLSYPFSNEIREFKDLENLEKMAKLFKYGINRFNNLKNYDIIVPPPRGEKSKPNHIKRAAELVSNETGIPVKDVLEKKEEYTSQKKIENPEDRKENVREKMKCNTELEADRILLLDDVATTCSTLSESARALRDQNAALVRGLVLGRDTKLKSLKDANIIEETE
ncbi:MAG: ComF family protein [Candidatus Nanohalobium sp.]